MVCFYVCVVFFDFMWGFKKNFFWRQRDTYNSVIVTLAKKREPSGAISICLGQSSCSVRGQ